MRAARLLVAFSSFKCPYGCGWAFHIGSSLDDRPTRGRALAFDRQRLLASIDCKTCECWWAQYVSGNTEQPTAQTINEMRAANLQGNYGDRKRKKHHRWCFYNWKLPAPGEYDRRWSYRDSVAPATGSLIPIPIRAEPPKFEMQPSSYSWT